MTSTTTTAATLEQIMEIGETLDEFRFSLRVNPEKLHLIKVIADLEAEIDALLDTL